MGSGETEWCRVLCSSTLGPAGPLSPLAPSRPLNPCTQNQSASRGHQQQQAEILPPQKMPQTHSVSLDAGESGGSGDSASSLEENRRSASVGFAGVSGGLSQKKQRSGHSPRYQRVHAHLGDQTCQAHPISDKGKSSNIHFIRIQSLFNSFVEEVW